MKMVPILANILNGNDANYLVWVKLSFLVAMCSVITESLDTNYYS